MKAGSRVITLLVLIIATLCSTTRLGAGPEVPGAPQTRPVALVGGTIHPVNGPAFPAGTLLFDAGKILAIGKQVDLPANVRRIDVTGKHVFPSLFDAYTNLGLVEINSVRATRDYRETGQINPNVHAQVAVNPDSELIPVTRSSGVLLALTAPTGGVIAGQSAVLQLDGWTWEDLTLKAGAGMHVDWPTMPAVIDWTEDRGNQNEEREAALEQLQRAFDDARAYQLARQADDRLHPIDIRWEAMLPVLRRELPLIVVADEVQEIQSAIAFSEREHVRLIIHGGYDAMHCAELINQHEIPVIVAGVYRLPRRESDPYDAPFTLPARLHKAGIKFCISGSGRFGATNVRNLPFHAAMAAAFGLEEDEALKAITSYPADILGVADRVGSLEVGKDATLFVSDGHPFATETQIEAAFVQGREVDLSDRHKRLWQKYQAKYRRE
jgi:imidazolonepropionase-like amidohydrolase